MKAADQGLWPRLRARKRRGSDSTSASFKSSLMAMRADADVFLRAMETVLNAHRATPSADRQAVEIFRQLFDEAIAELDQKQPRRT
jgi:hypothetical protein